jgi:putative tricarboxylic transport membrane protein
VLAFVSGPITLLFLGLSIVSLALPFIQARRAKTSAA